MKRAGTLATVLTSITLVVTGLLAVPAAPAAADVRSPVIGDFHDASRGGLFDTLTRLEGRSLPGFLGAHRDKVRSLLRRPPAAGLVASRWRGLSAAKRTALEKDAPRVVGNLDGIPLAVRGRVNAAELQRRIAEVRTALAHSRGGARERLLTTAQGLDRVARALAPTADGPERTLAVFDTTGSWRAVVVLGDLSTARYVTYLVPGMFFRVQQQIDDWARTAQTLYDDEAAWASRLGLAGGIATVAWIGYRTPRIDDVADLALARRGADFLQGSLAALRTARAGDEPHVSVVAHSYGSTAALLALQRQNVSVDALAVLGSPGSDASSVRALDVRAGKVFVGDADYDPVAHSAYFGHDPSARSYGAERLGVAGGVDPITGADLAPSYGHNEYFTPGSESMRNLAVLGLGRGDLVLRGDGSTRPFATVRARSLLLRAR